LLSSSLRAALTLAVAGAAVGFDTEVHAADTHASSAPAPPAEPPARIRWGLRVSGGVGLAVFSDQSDRGLVWRLGLDGEYWLSKNIGIGAQLGYQALATLDWLGGSWENANRLSLAPSITLRGSNPMNFPALSLAAGVSWGHREEGGYSCDPGPDCNGNAYSRSDSSWEPYGSLTGEWVFHPGDVRPGTAVLAIGPMLRIDWFPLDSDRFSFGPFGWTFTTGMTLGFGAAAP
jgi:hypothetical protein